MNLVPFTREKSELARLHKDMDDLVTSFFGGRPLLFTEREVWPAIDISEDENSITVRAEVPGCRAEDVDISVQGNILMITGEKRQEKEEKEADYHVVKRSYGSFLRSVQLPKEVQSDKISASYKNGILRITLPKSEEAKKKEIKIKVE